jgi:hypothetical protein
MPRWEVKPKNLDTAKSIAVRRFLLIPKKLRTVSGRQEWRWLCWATYRVNLVVVTYGEDGAWRGLLRRIGDINM